MDADQLVDWIRETEARSARLPEALTRLHRLTGMSFGAIGEATGMGKGTAWKRVQRHQRAAQPPP